MPRGHLTPFPDGWLPLKTDYGWTAIRLRTNGGGVTGCDMPRTGDGLHVAFWRRRKEVAEVLEGWALVVQNEELQKENQRLRALLAQRPIIPGEGLPGDISS